MKDYFSTYHPLVNFLYFVFVIGVSMFLMHPLYLAVSLFCATAYSCKLKGIRKTGKGFLLFTLPMMVIVALINPMFNHYGVTVLFYLRNGNPVTLESMVYGVAMSAMLCAVVLWFGCYHEIMTSDKFIYLFGRLIPALSLVLSMCLRFVPKLKSRLRTINSGQKCIGRDAGSGNLVQKVRHGVNTLSILVTWSLENAINTADSMKSRGYGLKGRTAFSIYRFDKRDKALLALMGGLSLAFAFGSARGYTFVMYDPRIKISGFPPTAGSLSGLAAYLLFCLLPVILDAVDDRKWRMLRSGVHTAKGGGYRLWSW